MTKHFEKDDNKWPSFTMNSQHPSLKKLEPIEKQYLLSVEHGDVVTVSRMLEAMNRKKSANLDINCKDPLGRSAIRMAIDNENLHMLQLLLDKGVESRDALLHAINAEYVEAVDLLLEHEELIHKEGKPHSWENVDKDTSTFTPEITPLILAAQKDNYEILKILLDKGASLPMPHDVRCRCRDCVYTIEDDCLYHSRSRINAYRALSSPSLICLSSIDPILTAFELSREMRRLSEDENEFKQDYLTLRTRCQDFATALLDHIRSSRELEMVLNYDPMKPPYQHGEHMPLARIDLAINYKQKKFIAHPHVQQLLSTLWYEGLPGFRRHSSIYELWEIFKIGVLFPFYSIWYMIFPTSETGRLVKKPFFKFIIHSFSYLFFLFLLILASQRVETLIAEWFGSAEMQKYSYDALKKQRGQPPTLLEIAILVYVIAHIWQETKELWIKGLILYFDNMWNIIDFTRNSLYVCTVIMRVLAYFQAQSEISEDPMAVYIPREDWEPYDPMLIADGLFAAGNIFAALKLVHMFSINPYLGPLQISLGRMVIDIIKFFFIYALVLFAFACGLNQLLWYYADMEKQKCFSGPNNTENWTQQRDACLAWRRFSNLFESSQTLFWASFGLVDIGNFELTGIKSYTRFWGLLMFGSYSVINVVVLLNLLIAMMSTSYNIISERADIEWKFARTKLFMNYFEEGSTVPPPFNIVPTLKNVLRLFGKQSSSKDTSTKRNQSFMKEMDSVYQSVMCNLVWRYVTSQQKEKESHPITEDNIGELRQDVHSFRHDIMQVLKNNGMNTSDAEKDEVDVTGKRIQVHKRRLIKDFSIGLMEVCTEEAAPAVSHNKGVLARLVGLSGTERRSSQKWRDLIQAVQKSKFKSNIHKDNTNLYSIKKNYDDEITINTTSENNKSGKTEKKEASGYKQCAIISEKNSTQKSQEKTSSHILSQPQPSANNPQVSLYHKKDKVSSKKSALKGIKLSPEAFLEQEKSSAPKQKPSSHNKYFSPAALNKPNFDMKPAENISHSGIDADLKCCIIEGNLMNDVCKNTTITVTSSPEKLYPKNGPVASIDKGNGQHASELTDRDKEQDSSTIFKVPGKNDLNITKKDSEDGIINAEAESNIYFQPPERNITNLSQNEKLNISPNSAEVVTFEKAGWF